MVPSLAAVLRAPRKLREKQFFICFICFLLFYVLDVVSITVYDRHPLLNIGSSVAQRKPDFEFLNAGALFTDTASEPFVWAARPIRPRRRKRSRIWFRAWYCWWRSPSVSQRSISFPRGTMVTYVTWDVFVLTFWDRPDNLEQTLY